jgi:hypothetical protein
VSILLVEVFERLEPAVLQIFFSMNWNPWFLHSDYFFSMRTGGSFKRFQRTTQHCYLPSSKLCHVSFAVSKFEVGERERERYGRQKKDQNNIEERPAALC